MLVRSKRKAWFQQGRAWSSLGKVLARWCLWRKELIGDLVDLVLAELGQIDTADLAKGGVVLDLTIDPGLLR